MAVFGQKIDSIAWLYKKYGPESCTKHFFQGNYMSQTFGTTHNNDHGNKILGFYIKTGIINKTADIIYNKKAVLSQRRPCDAPYILLPWKFCTAPDYAHAPLSPKFLTAFC